MISVLGKGLLPTSSAKVGLSVSGTINAALGLRADFFFGAFLAAFFGAFLAAFFAAFFGAFLAAFFGAFFEAFLNSGISAAGRDMYQPRFLRNGRESASGPDTGLIRKGTSFRDANPP